MKIYDSEYPRLSSFAKKSKREIHHEKEDVYVDEDDMPLLYNGLKLAVEDTGEEFDLDPNKGGEISEGIFIFTSFSKKCTKSLSFELIWLIF